MNIDTYYALSIEERNKTVMTLSLKEKEKLLREIRERQGKIINKTLVKTKNHDK